MKRKLMKFFKYNAYGNDYIIIDPNLLSEKILNTLNFDILYREKGFKFNVKEPSSKVFNLTALVSCTNCLIIGILLSLFSISSDIYYSAFKLKSIL